MDLGIRFFFAANYNVLNGKARQRFRKIIYHFAHEKRNKIG
jgi:hypothetical protein